MVFRVVARASAMIWCCSPRGLASARPVSAMATRAGRSWPRPVFPILIRAVLFPLGAARRLPRGPTIVISGTQRYAPSRRAVRRRPCELDVPGFRAAASCFGDAATPHADAAPTPVEGGLAAWARTGSGAVGRWCRCAGGRLAPVAWRAHGRRVPGALCRSAVVCPRRPSLPPAASHLVGSRFLGAEALDQVVTRLGLDRDPVCLAAEAGEGPVEGFQSAEVAQQRSVGAAE